MLLSNATHTRAARGLNVQVPTSNAWEAHHGAGNAALRRPGATNQEGAPFVGEARSQVRQVDELLRTTYLRHRPPRVGVFQGIRRHARGGARYGVERAAVPGGCASDRYRSESGDADHRAQ